MDFSKINYSTPTTKVSSKKHEKDEQITSTSDTKSASETNLPGFAQVSSIVAGIKCNISSPVVNSPVADSLEVQTKSEKEISELPFYNCIGNELLSAMVNLNREDNKNSSNLKLLLNLIKNNDADIYTLNHIFMDSNIEQNMADDMLLVQKAKDENIPIEDLFVPKFNSEEEAVQNSKAGDVYQLNDEKNIYYNNGKSVSQLKMDKETYMKLFPPIERFSTKQQRNGDCYLISTINSIFQNPETRNHIFDCFEQDGDDVKVKFPNSDKVYTIKNGSLKEHGTLTESQYIKGAEGIKILECIYGDLKRDKYMDHAQSKFDAEADAAVKELLEVQNLSVKKENRLSAIEQYQRDIEYLESIENKDEKIKNKINQLKSKVGNLKGYNKNITRYIRNEKSFEHVAFKNIDSRNHFYNDSKNNADNVYLEKVLSHEYKKDDNGYITEVKIREERNPYEQPNRVRLVDGNAVKASYGNNRNYYREAGVPAEVFTFFSMPVREYVNVGAITRGANYGFNLNRPNVNGSQFNFENFKQEIVKNINEGKNFILVGSTTNNVAPNLRAEKGLVCNHGYSIHVDLNENNQLRYKVVNPWNTAYNTELSEDEVKRHFGYLYVAN